MSKDIEQKIRESLIKDFEALYVKEFTASYQAERIIRRTEIGVMRLDNLKKLIKE
jgi:hypothetical protein